MVSPVAVVRSKQEMERTQGDQGLVYSPVDAPVAVNHPMDTMKSPRKYQIAVTSPRSVMREQERQKEEEKYSPFKERGEFQPESHREANPESHLEFQRLPLLSRKTVSIMTTETLSAVRESRESSVQTICSEVEQNLQKECSEMDPITKCPSLKRIIGVLRFHEKNGQNTDAMEQRLSRSTVIDDYIHILTVHFGQGKDNDEMNGAMMYQKVIHSVKCDLRRCPYYYDRDPSMHKKLKKSRSSFYRNLMRTVHCYFLHPFHTGFKMMHEKGSGDKRNTIGFGESLADENLQQLKTLYFNEIRTRDAQAMTSALKHKRQHRFNKFVLDPPPSLVTGSGTDQKEDDLPPPSEQKEIRFGRRYYYWNWHKKSSSEDWRCNPGIKYKALYVVPCG